jgi:hypothetical protein
LWTCAAYLVLGITLWRPRTVAVAETAIAEDLGQVLRWR